MPRRAYEVQRFPEAAYVIFSMLVPGMSVIVLPSILAATGHRPFRIGAIVAAQNWGMLLAPLWGRLVDGRRSTILVIVASLALLSAAFIGIGFGRSLDTLLFWSFMLGLGGGGAATASTSTLTNSRGLIGTSRITGVIGRVQALGVAGALVGFLAAGFLPLRGCVLLGAVSALTFALIGLFGTAHADDPTVEPPEVPTSLRPSISVASYVNLVCTWLLLSMATAEFSSQFPITMLNVFGVSRGAATLALALGAVVSLPLYVVAVRGITRFGSAATLAVGVGTRAILAVGLAVLAIVCPAVPVAALVLAAGFQAVWPLIGLPATRIAVAAWPRASGTSLGLSTALAAVASGLGSITGGYVADRSGYTSALVCAATFWIVSFVLSTIQSSRLNTPT